MFAQHKVEDKFLKSWTIKCSKFDVDSEFLLVFSKRKMEGPQNSL